MIPSKSQIRSAYLQAVAVAVAVATVLIIGVWIGAFTATTRVLVTVVALIAAGVVFVWQSRGIRCRQRAVAAATTPQQQAALQEIALYRALSTCEQQRFAAMVRVLLAEKPIVGVGCQLDERIRTLISAGLVMPIFRLPAWEFEDLQRVLVYPHSFRDPLHQDEPAQDPLALGMVTADEGLLDGLLMLSLPDVRAAFDNPEAGHQVVIHECAHMVDRASGAIDGHPLGLDADQRERLLHFYHEGQRGGLLYRDIPDYAFTDPEEFFAVCSECFFWQPQRFRRRHGELYELFRLAYRQDPAALLDHSF